MLKKTALFLRNGFPYLSASGKKSELRGTGRAKIYARARYCTIWITNLSWKTKINLNSESLTHSAPTASIGLQQQKIMKKQTEVLHKFVEIDTNASKQYICVFWHFLQLEYSNIHLFRLFVICLQSSPSLSYSFTARDSKRRTSSFFFGKIIHITQIIHITYIINITQIFRAYSSNTFRHLQGSLKLVSD